MKNLKNSIIEKLKQKVIQGFKPEVVLLDDVSKTLEDYVVISKQELRMKLGNAEKQMKSCQKGSPMWFETAYQHGYFVIKEILGES